MPGMAAQVEEGGGDLQPRHAADGAARRRRQGLREVRAVDEQYKAVQKAARRWPPRTRRCSRSPASGARRARSRGMTPQDAATRLRDILSTTSKKIAETDPKIDSNDLRLARPRADPLAAAGRPARVERHRLEQDAPQGARQGRHRRLPDDAVLDRPRARHPGRRGLHLQRARHRRHGDVPVGGRRRRRLGHAGRDLDREVRGPRRRGQDGDLRRQAARHAASRSPKRRSPRSWTRRSRSSTATRRSRASPGAIAQERGARGARQARPAQRRGGGGGHPEGGRASSGRRRRCGARAEGRRSSWRSWASSPRRPRSCAARPHDITVPNRAAPIRHARGSGVAPTAAGRKMAAAAQKVFERWTIR